MRERPKHAPTPTKKKVMDEDIRAHEIQFIDAAGKFQGLQPLRDVLASFDRGLYNLVCVNPHAKDQPLTCKLLLKTEVAEAERKSYRAEREKRKERREKNPNQILKEVELSWAISEHDLGHRMKKVREFMEKGNRVAVTLGTKKGMAKQTIGAMAGLLKAVRGECEEWGKEIKEPEGQVGRRYTMLFEGDRVKVKKDDGKDAEEEAEAEEEVEAEENEGEELAEKA